MTTTRRALLGGAAGGLALTGLTGLTAAPAQAATPWDARPGRRRPRALFSAPSTSGATGLSSDPVLHLLRRATFGATPALVAEVRRTGAAAWLDQQLAPSGLADPVADAVVARLPLITRTAAQLHAQLQVGSWDAMGQLVLATTARHCWSTRQLYEVMVDFWSNHLNVTCPSSDVWDVRAVDDRDVYRKHALGRFDDMLVASATSPSMLRYLNGASSRATAPNENYGREVLELHTVGIGAGYTQADVVDSARALTGLTIDDDGRFTYRSDWHWTGALRVLDWSSDNATRAGGRAVAEDYLRHLARHPATAARLARKLAVRFVSDDPPQALVDRLAAVYLAQGTAVVPVLRALFASREFAASVGQKTRRPYEDLVATVRALGLGPGSGTDGVQQLVWLAGDRAQPPLGWHPPNGYPDVAPAWASAGGSLTVWRDHISMAAGWWPEAVAYDGPDTLLPSATPATCGALVDALSERLMQQRLPAAQRTAVLGFLGRGAGDPPSDEHTGWQLPWVVSLVLDAPVWSLR